MLKINLFIFLIMAFFIGHTFAQDDNEEQKSPFDLNLNFEEPGKASDFIVPQPAWLGQSYEKVLDPSEYIIGPGDQFILKILSVNEQQFVITVTPEGYLVIPTIPRIYVAGKSITEAEEAVVTEMEKIYKNAEFTLNILQMRTLKLYVVGEINKPGTYTSTPVNRVSDIISMAGGFTNWANEREIEIRYNTGKTDTIEISKFFMDGNLNQNPLISGGEIVYIPSIDLNKTNISIESNVIADGVYQVKAEESLYDFLKRNQALNRNTDLENIMVKREGRQFVLNLATEVDKVKDFKLQNRDLVLLPSVNNRVFVSGEVARPGSYPFIVSYTSKDYAGYAGILESSKSINSIIVVHSGTGETEKGRDVVIKKGDIIIIPKKTRDVVRDYLTIIVPVISLGVTAYGIITR